MHHFDGRRLWRNWIASLGDPTVMGGKPCIRGMRVTVGMIVGQIGAGHTIEELLADYPYLQREDILRALRYGAWLAEEREITLPRA